MNASGRIRRKCTVLHETGKRIRTGNPVFHDPAFDPVYMEAILCSIEGVSSARFNLRAGSVAVEYDGSSTCRQFIIDTLGDIPPEAVMTEHEKISVPDPVGVIAKSVSALLIPAVPGRLKVLPASALGLPVIFKGIDALVSRGIKVEVLDAATIAFSMMRRDYFTAGAIAALLSLGEYLEELSDEKATELIRRLLRKGVESIRILKDGLEVMIPAGDVRIGDLVVCGSGEMIPVDGTVFGGDASVNQSAVTGESIPVHLREGEDAISGAVVEDGRIVIRAVRVGSETSLARINRFLANSLKFRSKAQKKSEELADRLVPVTFALGTGIFALTGDVRRAASVLAVDYSCAIKLANPVAVKSSMYAAAHCGVLLKGAAALDSLAKVDTVVFDKTGTLTRGIPEVTDIVSTGSLDNDGLLGLAAAAESSYAHPVARAIVREAGNRGVPVPSAGHVDFIVAHGVSAFVEGSRVLAGSWHFICEDEGIDCSCAEAHADRLRKEGRNILYVARDGILEGIIAVMDELRPEAPRFLRSLKKTGIRKIIALTGDHRDTALAVAKKLDGLDEIRWDLKPEEKAEIVRELKNQGCRVAFAGDGVNDAPALVTADVGICMPNGADLARESAQVVLLSEDLELLLKAREIAVRADRTIRNSFAATVGINSAIMLAAASGHLLPLVSAVLHNMTTIGILGYSAVSCLGKPEGDKKRQKKPLSLCHETREGKTNEHAA